MSNQELLLTKDGKEDLNNFVKRPTLKFQSESIESLSSSSNSQYSHKEGKSNHQEVEEYQQICRIGVSKEAADSESSSLNFKEEDDDDEEEEEDGFKTPTSLDHKISIPSKCPPAPRKTKQSLKRKASYYNNCRQPLDLSKEIFELLFPTQHHTNSLSSSQQTTKKVRRQEHKS